MHPLARALLRVWWQPDIALAHARVGLSEAEASGCPLRIAEWSRAVAWLQWIAGHYECDWRLPSIRAVLDDWHKGGIL